MPLLLLALGAGAVAFLGSSQAQAAALTAIKFRLQSMLWGMHMIRAGYECGYTRTEVLEFSSEDEARAALAAYTQKYANPPMAFVQLLKVAYDPKQPFSEQLTVLADSGGPRNKPGPCAPPPSSVGYSFFSQPSWRYFRMVLGGRIIYQRGPVLMSDDDAMNEKMGMMDAALTHGSTAIAQQFNWTGSGWRSA